MSKNLMILIALLSYHETNFASISIENIAQDDKEIIILAANPEEKKVLQDFLFNPESPVSDPEHVKKILRRLLLESEKTQPMMTMTTQGE